jgi:integrase
MWATHSENYPHSPSQTPVFPPIRSKAAAAARLPERNAATVPPNINQAHERNAGALKLPELIDTEFLDSAKTDRLYAAFLLELNTGLRRGEVLGLR